MGGHDRHDYGGCGVRDITQYAELTFLCGVVGSSMLHPALGFLFATGFFLVLAVLHWRNSAPAEPAAPAESETDE